MSDKFAMLRGLISPETATNLYKQMQVDLAAQNLSFEIFASDHALARRLTIDISSHCQRQLITFL